MEAIFDFVNEFYEDSKFFEIFNIGYDWLFSPERKTFFRNIIIIIIMHFQNRTVSIKPE